MSMDHRSLVLLTGASGYIGGRLLKALEAAGRPVRCLARHPEFLVSRVSSSTVVVQADCLDRTSLALALEGVDTAYYLVHSMGSAPEPLKRSHRRRCELWRFGWLSEPRPRPVRR